MYPTNDGPGIIHIPAKKFDMPKKRDEKKNEGCKKS